MKRTIHPISVFQKTKQWEKMPKYILEDTSIAGIIDTISPTMIYSHCFKEAILWDVVSGLGYIFVLHTIPSCLGVSCRVVPCFGDNPHIYKHTSPFFSSPLPFFCILKFTQIPNVLY